MASNLGKRRSGELHYQKVKLVGTQSNRVALGAKVVVTAGNRRWTQIHDGKSGYLGQSSMPLHFGLADATTIDRIDVTWPGGTTSKHQGGSYDQPTDRNRRAEMRTV